MYQTVGHQLVEAYSACMGVPLIRRRIQGTSALQDLAYTRTDGDEVEDLYALLAYAKVREVHRDRGAVSEGVPRREVQHKGETGARPAFPQPPAREELACLPFIATTRVARYIAPSSLCGALPVLPSTSHAYRLASLLNSPHARPIASSPQHRQPISPCRSCTPASRPSRPAP